MGVTNLSGERTAEYSYGENGEVLAKFVRFDGTMAKISSTAHNTPSSGQSTITMASALFSADQYNGAQIVVSVPVPGAGSDTYRVGTVIDTTTSTLVISDNATLNESIAKALYSSSTVIDDFVLFDFNDSTQANAPSGYTLGGTWSSVSHSGGTTTLTRSSGNFQSWLVGCLVVPNVNFSSYFEITGVTSTTLTVTGDLTSIVTSGDYFRVHIPVGANKSTGTLAAYDAVNESWTWDVASTGTRYLWASYLYMPPMMGFTDGDGFTVGGQGGSNKLGQYHCNNRQYDIKQGRWISPDQAARPWFDLFDYAECQRIQRMDPTGLEISVNSTDSSDLEYLLALFKRICPDMTFTWSNKNKDGKVDKDYRFLTIQDYGGITSKEYPCLNDENGNPGPGQEAYKGKVGCRILYDLFLSDNMYWITFTPTTMGQFNPKAGGGGEIMIDKKADKDTEETLPGFHGPGWRRGAQPNLSWSRARQLAHEMAHAWRNEKGQSCFGIAKEEQDTVRIENAIAEEIKANDDAVRAKGGSIVGGAETGTRRIDTGKHQNPGDPADPGLPDNFPYEE